MQLRFWNCGGGANHSSLVEAQAHFISANQPGPNSKAGTGASGERRDPGWRPLGSEDVAEDWAKRGTPYPDDLTELYYWRR